MSRANDIGQEARPIPDITNAKDLAEVLVASILITASIVSTLPEQNQVQGLEAILYTTEQYIQAYTDRHFVRIDRPEEG